MMDAMGIFDMVLALALPWLGWRLLASPDLFRAVVLFISLGLLMALTWVRLQAPDVALAEAAIGAGLTGALFLSALRRLERLSEAERRLALAGKREEEDEIPPERRRRAKPVAYGLALLLLAVFVLLLAWSLAQTPAGGGLGPAVAEQLGQSGVRSEVTAVLLNFRGYDTLLEVMVLFLAALGVWSLTRVRLPLQDEEPGLVLATLVRLLAPLMIMVAGYLVWIGGSRAGGAFQGGAVLAAAGVLLLLANVTVVRQIPAALLRWGLALGPLLFLLTAVVCVAAGGKLLEYPPQRAGAWILLIESASAVSIGVTLAALYAGGRPPEPPAQDRGGEQGPGRGADAGGRR
ncbi:MAG: hydrogen gas-evolving membrane-bound hydrogenase subunit E [Thermodesulfobacteriota bacterium]